MRRSRASGTQFYGTVKTGESHQDAPSRGDTTTLHGSPVWPGGWRGTDYREKLQLLLSPMHTCIPLIRPEDLVCARHCPRCWGHSREQDRPRPLSSWSSHVETHVGLGARVGDLGSLLRICCMSIKCSVHSGDPYSRERSDSISRDSPLGRWNRSRSPHSPGIPASSPLPAGPAAPRRACFPGGPRGTFMVRG